MLFRPSTKMEVGPLQSHVRETVRQYHQGARKPYQLATASAAASSSSSPSSSKSSGTSTSGGSASTTKKERTTAGQTGKSPLKDRNGTDEEEGGGHTHLYRDGTRRGFFQGSYADRAPPQVRFASDKGAGKDDAPNFLVTTRPRVVKSDMSDDLLAYAVETAQAALDRYRDDIDVSCCVKMRLEERFQGCWVVVVGAHYATFVTEDCFQPGTFCYFFVGTMGFLIFKCF